MTSPICPLCGHPETILLDAHAALCPKCDVLINRETAPLDYSDGGGQAVPDPAKMRWRLENARRRFRLMSSWLTGVEVFVDIGCGSGEMIEAAKGRFEYPIGFDTNRPLIEHIRQNSLATAIEGHFDPAALPPEITGRRTLFALSHVLEHLAHPLTLLQLILGTMRPGDLLYVEVPLYTGESFRKLGYGWSLWNPEHVMLFSQLSLDYLAAQSGSEVLTRGTRIFARGSHSTKVRLRLLRNSPLQFLKALFSKPGYLSVADVLVADYGYLLFRRNSAAISSHTSGPAQILEFPDA